MEGVGARERQGGIAEHPFELGEDLRLPHAQRRIRARVQELPALAWLVDRTCGHGLQIVSPAARNSKHGRAIGQAQKVGLRAFIRIDCRIPIPNRSEIIEEPP